MLPLSDPKGYFLPESTTAFKYNKPLKKMSLLSPTKVIMTKWINLVVNGIHEMKELLLKIKAGDDSILLKILKVLNALSNKLNSDKSRQPCRQKNL